MQPKELDEITRILESPWRVGRKVGRTVYVVSEHHPSGDGGPLIGVMDTKEIAAKVVEDHNARIEEKVGERLEHHQGE